ncbi:MAG: hypothetical protein EFT35_03485 [Methanophagales archaeon ANME-1-THS]|nr:MAG: hypothetical protein EFT35_03485 [Methanophagales archaeon ANME-1-THS]
MASESTITESASASNSSEITKPDAGSATGAQYLNGHAPLIFEENRGQTDAQVKFISRNNDDTLFLTPTGIIVVLSKLAIEPGALEMKADVIPAKVNPLLQKNYSVERVAFRVDFVNGNPEPEVKGLDPLPSTSNYFLSTDSQKGYTQIPHYARVQYRDLYPGIDVEVASSSGRLSQRLIIQDGVFIERACSRLQNVKLRVEGADDVMLEDDHVRIITTLGDYILPLVTIDRMISDLRPSILQKGPEIFEITAPFAPASASDRYLTSNSGQGLLFSTYPGGTGNDIPYDIAIDSAGNVYVTGATTSLDFPTTQGAYDASYNGDPFDAVVTKLSADGKTLIYST